MEETVIMATCVYSVFNVYPLRKYEIWQRLTQSKCPAQWWAVFKLLRPSLNWVIIGACNGLSPFRCQTITWTNDDILSIGPLGTKFSDICIEIKTFSLTKLHSKMSSNKVATILSRPQCVNQKYQILYISIIPCRPCGPNNIIQNGDEITRYLNDSSTNVKELSWSLMINKFSLPRLRWQHSYVDD